MNTRILYKYGIGTGLALILFFIIMNLVGLAYVTELRYLNILILMGGLYAYLKKLS
jgi:hypothetical protein